MKILITTSFLVLMSACGNPSGSFCEIEGSGFTASHDCRYQCLSRTAVVCPDGNKILPKQCSGKPYCRPGTCGSGEACYTVTDPFESKSYCVSISICEQKNSLSENLSPQAVRDIRAWEERAYAEAEHVRKEQALRDERRRHAGGGVTNAEPTSLPPSNHDSASDVDRPMP